MKYKVYNKKTREDLTDKNDWVITPEGQLYYLDYESLIGDPDVIYIEERNNDEEYYSCDNCGNRQIEDLDGTCITCTSYDGFFKKPSNWIPMKNIATLKNENKELRKKLEYYETGTDICDMEAERARGQQEAWKFVKNIALSEEYGGYSNNELKEIFGSICLDDIFNLTYTEAAAKVEAWELQKEEIIMGDVVCHEGSYGVVFCMSEDGLFGITSEGWKFEFPKKECTKTGRHIDLNTFLKQIGGEK